MNATVVLLELKLANVRVVIKHVMLQPPNNAAIKYGVELLDVLLTL